MYNKAIYILVMALFPNLLTVLTPCPALSRSVERFYAKIPMVTFLDSCDGDYTFSCKFQVISELSIITQLSPEFPDVPDDIGKILPQQLINKIATGIRLGDAGQCQLESLWQQLESGAAESSRNPDDIILEQGLVGPASDCVEAREAGSEVRSFMYWLNGSAIAWSTCDKPEGGNDVCEFVFSGDQEKQVSVDERSYWSLVLSPIPAGNSQGVISGIRHIYYSVYGDYREKSIYIMNKMQMYSKMKLIKSRL